jgi:hypothetical protein
MWNPIAMIRRTDPDDTVPAAEASITQIEQRMTALVADRAEKLLTEDFSTDDVGRIDRELATLNANIVIHRERASALKVRQRAQHQKRLELEKKTAMEQIAIRLSRRYDLARRLDKALAEVEAACNDLVTADDDAFKNWSDTLPRANLLAYTRATVIPALATRGQRQPLFAGIIRTIAQHGAYGFASAVDQANRELMQELQSAPIPEPNDQEAAA